MNTEKIKSFGKKNFYRIAAISVAILSAAFFIFCATFTIIFHMHNDYSTTIHWLASFGEFVGGVFGVILALANLAIFIWISIYIQDLGEKHNLNSMEIARTLAVMEIKISEYRRFKDEVEPSMKAWLNDLKNLDLLLDFHNRYISETDRMKTIFPNSITKIAEIGEVDSLIVNYSHPGIEEDSAKRLVFKIKGKYYKLLEKLGAWIFEDLKTKGMPTP